MRAARRTADGLRPCRVIGPLRPADQGDRRPGSVQHLLGVDVSAGCARRAQATQPGGKMNGYEYTPWIWPLLGSAAFVGAVGLYLWRRRETRGALPLSLLALVTSLWCLTHAAEISATAFGTQELWFVARDALAFPAVMFSLWFALAYAGLDRLLTRPVVARNPRWHGDRSRAALCRRRWPRAVERGLVGGERPGRSHGYRRPVQRLRVRPVRPGHGGPGRPVRPIARAPGAGRPDPAGSARRSCRLSAGSAQHRVSPRTFP